MEPGSASQGLIKSFSLRSGYGFITDGSTGDDVFFGKEALPVEFTVVKCEGIEVHYEVTTNAKGKLQAINIRRNRPVKHGDITSGTVKSWNANKGFGFLTSPDLEGDVFFARDRLPDRLKEVHALENLTMVFELIKGEEDGKMQARNMRTPTDEPQAGMNMNKRQFQGNDMNMGPSKRMNLGPDGFVGRLVGHVKSYSMQTGYGFIVSDQYNTDIVVYDKELEHLGGSLNKGDFVEFELRFGGQGKPQAVNIQRGNESGMGQPQRSLQQQPQLNSRPLNEYPTLTVHDLKLYADQLNAQDLGELAAHATQALQAKMAQML